MGHILNTLTPIFAVILLGFLLGRKGFLSQAFLDKLNDLVYWVTLPALIIGSLMKSEGVPDSAFRLMLVFLGVTTLFILLMAGLAALAKLEHWRRGTFVQSTFRGNQAFIGLPVLVYALSGRAQAEIDSVISLAVILFAPTMLLYNVASVVVLTLSAQSEDGIWKMVRGSVIKILRNPLILSCGVGVFLMLLPFQMQGALPATLDYIGRTAGPLALLCVGGGMAYTPLSQHWKPALSASILKVAVLPALMWLVAGTMSFTRNEMLILLIFASTPTAVASYVMAMKLRGDTGMSAGTIFLSTACSIIPLGVIVGFYSS